MSHPAARLASALKESKGEKPKESKGKKKGKAKKAATKAPAKKATKKKKATTKKKAPAKKSTKTKAPAKRTVKASDRNLDRSKDGDGLRPVERKLLKLLEKHGGELAIVDLARKMYGREVASEGPESVRTVRNGIRMPIAYGIMEIHKRGLVRLTAAYKRSKNIERFADKYRAEVTERRQEAAQAAADERSKKAKKAAAEEDKPKKKGKKVSAKKKGKKKGKKKAA